MSDNSSLSDWIAHVFDHPVTKPAWHWADDPPIWDGPLPRVAELIAETFEQSGRWLAPFSNEQLAQGFWYLVDGSCSNFMLSLTDEGVDPAVRLRALRSFVPLFEQVMASRCTPHLSHLDEPGRNSLNTACYMWWDILPIHGQPEIPARAPFDAEVLAVLKKLLAIPQDACRESALHGIGHWSLYYPKGVAIVDEFLLGTPGMRTKLMIYAACAKEGNVL